MPMYEYDCKTCGKSFDLLRRMNQEDTDVVCAHCGATNVFRKLSLFASVAKDDNGANLSSAHDGGSCSSGLCGCNGSSCSF